MSSPVIKLKRGAYSDLPTLAVGEPGFTTDRYQLYVGSPDGNKLIGGGEFWNLNSTTVGGSVKVYEGTNNGTNFVALKSPDSLGSSVTLTLPSADASTSGQVLQSNASGVLSFADVGVANIDIDGATDIGASIVDADLFIVDDGASGTNRKTAASRIKDYILGGGTPTFSSATIGGQVLNGTGVNVTGVTTSSGGFVGALTGNVTGNVTGDVTGDLTGDVTGNVTGNLTGAASQVLTQKNETAGTYFFTFVDSNDTSATANSLYTDTTLNLNPATNVVSGGGMDMVAYFINSVEITSTATELNILDGATLSTTELNYVDGVTSNIQTQLDAKGTLTNQNDLVSLSGVSAGATTLGTFTGTTISDNKNTKEALQEVETALDNVVAGNGGAATVLTQSDSTDASFFPTFVSDNNGSATQEALKTDAGISYNPSSNLLSVASVTASGTITGDLTGNVTGNVTGNLDGIVGGNTPAVITGTIITANTKFIGNVLGNVTGNVTGDLTGDVTGDLTGNVTGNVTGNATSADTVDVTGDDSTNTSYQVVLVDGSGSGRTLREDSGFNYNPSSNTLSTGSAELSGYVRFDGAGVQVDGFTDEDNMASNSDTKLPTQQSVKAYVDTEIGNLSQTITLNGDSTAGIVTTGNVLSIDGTANEIETAVVSDTFTIGLPASVVVTTELEVPTLEVGAIQANDGTASMTVANSTGKVTASGDFEVQGATTVQALTAQGNVSLGDQSSDTVGFTGRINTDVVPSADSTNQLGSNSLRWSEVYGDSFIGSQVNVSGAATVGTLNGSSLTMVGGGTFGGNVDISGNLSVGGSITSINVDDFKSVSPLIEVGLEDVGDGTFQPPSFQTQYNTGIAMWYNPVGVSSSNAKAASIFASVKPGGSFRVGFATVVTFSGAGTTDGVASVTNWADIEAKGLWINDCAGQSQVISCTGSERFLNNITVDGGSFS